MNLTMEKGTKRVEQTKSAAAVFNYEEISPEFKKKLAQLARNGQSVALLGPRYIGKRRCVEFVTNELEQDENVSVKRLDFGDGMSWDNPLGKFSRRICELTKESCEKEELAIDKAFKDYLRDDNSKVIFCLSNLDLLADFNARQILKRIRVFHNSSRAKKNFSVLLTGSSGLVDLVSGDNSEFDCAHQFVVRGYSRKEFFEHLDNSVAVFGLELSDDAREQLFKDCGNATTGCSNVYLVRVFMWGLSESLRKGLVRRTASLSKEDIERAWSLLVSPWSFPVDFVTSAITKVTLSPNAYKQLSHLIAGQSIQVSRNSAPTELELSGTAIRTNDCKLVFSSPKMERFSKLYYTDWTLGDLFCSKGDWKMAHSIYSSELNTEVAERPHHSAAIQAFRAELYALAGKGINAVEAFFVKFVTRLLPIESVSVWSQEPEGIGTLGTQQPFDNPWFVLHGRERVPNKLWKMMPSPKLLKGKANEIYFGPEHNRSFVVIPIPNEGRDCVRAVVLNNLDSPSVIAGNNLAMIKNVVSDFRCAVAAASEHDDARQEAQLQSKLLVLLPKLLDGIVEQGGTIRKASIDFVLNETCKLIEQLKYRVVFSLDVNDSGMHLFKKKENKRDGWYSVLRNCFREDTKLSYLGVPHTPGKLFPLRGSNKKLLGTLEVARQDDIEMHKAEIVAFTSFTTQLAIILGITEQIKIFENAIRESPNVTVVVDEDDRVCYANEKAMEYYEKLINSGWQLHRPAASEILDRQQCDAFSLSKTTSLVNFDESTLTHIYPVKGFKHDRIGTVIQLVAFSEIDELFRQLTKLGECELGEDLLTGAMKAVKEFGFPSARLYQMNNGILIGRRVMNCKISEAELSGFRSRFERGFVSLPADRRGHSWNCLDARKPIVFCLRKGKEGLVRLASGVVAVNVQTAVCPTGLKKRNNDVWIDLPLINRESGEILGKLSIDCSSEISGLQVERLKVFAEFFSAALAAKLERQSSVRQGLKKVLHEIVNKTSPFKALATKYLDMDSPTCLDPAAAKKSADADFEKYNRAITAELQKVQDKFPTKIEPLLKTACIRKCIETTLKEYGHDLTSNIQANCNTVFEFDAKLIEQLFSHLISNTRKARSDAEIDIVIEVKVGCTITYRNNGPPIPIDRRYRIFEDFESKWEGEQIGSGIGLPLARAIARAHDGNLRAIPLTKGACFEVSLPTENLRGESSNGNQ